MFDVWNSLWHLVYDQSKTIDRIILFIVAKLFQHFPDFYILFVGRLLAGMATSILFSAFESWLINEHRRVCLKSIKEILLLSMTFYSRETSNQKR